MRIRAGRGLGDGVYLQSIARKFPGAIVCTDWPCLFPNNDTEPFTRHNIDKVAHYNTRRTEPTNIWEDMCIKARVKAELRFEWWPKSTLETDKPILFVLQPREPMNRTDRFATPLLPSPLVFNETLQAVRGKFTTVLVGKDKPLFHVEHSLIDIDQTQKSLQTYLDIAWQAECFFGQVSNLVPLAEGQNKKALFVWSSKGLNTDGYLSTITPRKTLTKDTSIHIVDDWTNDRIDKAINQFC